MKKLLVIIDGMDDEMNPDLGKKTPKDVAYMPGLKHMKEHGSSSMIKTIPYGFKPSTDTALLNILGYKLNPGQSWRTWFEAIGSGIDVTEHDLCIRCNIISLQDKIIKAHSVETISEKEVSNIINLLNQRFGNERIQFYPGNGFRTLLVIKNCDAEVISTPPHELLGKDLSSLKIDSQDSELKSIFNKIIEETPTLFSTNGIFNTGIAIWSADKMPVNKFKPISGAVIAGVNLVKGIGKAFGMNVPEVEGANGESTTNYKGKLQAAISALESEDFVLLHIEAPDEASHNRNPQQKVDILEKIDKFVISPLLDLNLNLNITVQSDHATSSLTGLHLDTPVERIEYIIHRNYES